ncbi:MAG: hypothetical protein V2I33_19985, partial [Kangiellaceae bacterium]|nr:hypothetical protein [Kangiellaceae bacterium]
MDITEINFPYQIFIPPATEAAILANLSNLGVALYGVNPDPIAFGVIEIEHRLGILLPKIFPMPPATELQDSEKYPYFNRLSISDEVAAVSMIETMKYWGWRKFTWIASNIDPMVAKGDSLISVGKERLVYVQNSELYLPLFLDL